MSDIREKVVYQIYPRSFLDTNGDGIGDLKGILEKLDYLKSLGVGYLWLSPVYLSPDRDNGYDIADYRQIDPKFGAMADMEALIAEGKKRGIGIVMDLVINHTSSEHEWFKKSCQGVEPYRDYYIWQDKPNNWGNFFGGESWSYCKERGQYYLHLFDKGQPDLNYRNEAVIREVEDILRFWLDKGVAGFRCDVINILWKTSLKNGRPSLALTGREHYMSQPGNHDLLKRFNAEVLSKYDCFTVGETVFVTPKQANLLVGADRGELDMVFSFEHMDADCFLIKWFPTKFRPKKLFKVLDKWQQRAEWNALYLENHDQPRSVSRFGSPDYPYESATALLTLLLTLRGTPYIYQGEEIGMTNFDYTSLDDIQDVETHTMNKTMKKLGIGKKSRMKRIKRASRDNARTPMQWNGGENGGFSTGKPWLKVNGNHTYINVEAQEKDENSVLAYARRLIAFRNDSPVLQQGAYEPLLITDRLYAYQRSLAGRSCVIALNLSKDTVTVPQKGRILVSNYGRIGSFSGELAPYEAAIFTEDGEGDK